MALPAYDRLAGDPERFRLEVPLTVITPIHGGGVDKRKPDSVDLIRVPGVRGQFRFWWRALFAGRFSPTDLHSAERALFGGMGTRPEDVTRSSILVEVEVTRPTDVDSSNVSLGQRDAYALWPSREAHGRNPAPVAPRRRPGLEFVLRVEGPAERRDEIVRTLRAWTLLGGIGGRTRRGCGALAPAAGVAETWLPPSLDEDALRAWLAPGSGRCDLVPGLAGARFALLPGLPSAAEAWHEALAWLREFRQGTSAGVDRTPAGDYARQRPVLKPGNAGRPGRSRWPEADKLRHLARRFDHPALPGHGPTPHWPRAEFGLPIQFQFQMKDRGDPPAPFSTSPPPPAMLVWVDREGTAHERLASPLILRPVAMRDGRFAPFCLWLARPLPPDAKVGVALRASGSSVSVRAGTEAGFGLRPPSGDAVTFLALDGKPSLRDAFFDWLAARSPRLRGGTL